MVDRLVARVRSAMGGGSRSDVALATGLVLATVMILVVVAAVVVAVMSLL